MKSGVVAEPDTVSAAPRYSMAADKQAKHTLAHSRETLPTHTLASAGVSHPKNYIGHLLFQQQSGGVEAPGLC